MLSVIEDGELCVMGVYGPYEDEQQANGHVGILRDLEMLKRLRGRPVEIHTSQHLLEDPSSFVDEVERLLPPVEE